MSSFEKLPAISGSVACATCGCGAHETLSMDRMLAVGFGETTVTQNGVCVWSESQMSDNADWSDYWKASNAESAALEHPDDDWRINFHAPLYDAEYQRQGDGHWVLVKKGMGFA